MEELAPLLSGFNELMKSGLEHVMPLVEEAINSQETDENELDRLFDSLLTYVMLNDGLALYRRFARYVYGFNPRLAYDSLSENHYTSQFSKPNLRERAFSFVSRSS
jgi:hypothetical protein